MRLIKKIFKLWSWKRILRNIYFLIKYDLQEREFENIFKVKDEILEEAIYEFDSLKKELMYLNVLDTKETLRLLRDMPKSFSRYGDGEINIMRGIDQPFQRYDKELDDKLKRLLMIRRDDIYIGLNHAYWERPNRYAERNRKFYRVYGTEFRRFFTSICDKKNIYLDAACFGAYFRYGEEFNFEYHYEYIKDLFIGKKVAIVVGEGVYEKLIYNIFEKADKQMIVNGPRINAFSNYNAIIKTINEVVPKDYLICIILGQTATVMVADLTDLGYMAWDIGHLAKDYDHYMRRIEKTKENMDAFWAPD